jgi:LysR family transcriptional regulator, nitrogen assimilation regulatory protein
MDLKQLEYFVHVAEMGSFTRAAALLQVAQPALSRQVRTLEVELRQPLLDRNGRGVTLTEAGKRLLAHARGILQQVQRARDDLEDQRGAATGRLAIALPPSVSRTLTAPLVQAFRDQMPRANLSVVEGLSTYALEWLLIGRVDCAVVYNVTPRGARVGKAIALSDVAARDLVMPSRPHSMRMLLETALAAEGCRASVALEIESIPAILDLVLRGGCHAVLAENAVRTSGHPEAFQLRPIGPPGLVATLWMATSAQRPRGPLIEQGTTLVAALLQQLWR